MAGGTAPHRSTSGPFPAASATVRLLCSLAWILVVAAAGCASPGSRTSNQAGPRFSEEEIRSKTWTDARGNHLELLDWTPVHLREDELVIAKYGQLHPRYVTCLEFYRVSRVPGGRAAQVIQPSVAPPPPTAAGYTNVAARVSFELLLHDYFPEMVTSTSSEAKGGDLVITVVRETVPGTEEVRQGLRYMLIYTRSSGIRWNPALEQWAIAKKAE